MTCLSSGHGGTSGAMGGHLRPCVGRPKPMGDRRRSRSSDQDLRQAAGRGVRRPCKDLGISARPSSAPVAPPRLGFTGTVSDTSPPWGSDSCNPRTDSWPGEAPTPAAVTLTRRPSPTWAQPAAKAGAGALKINVKIMTGGTASFGDPEPSRPAALERWMALIIIRAKITQAMRDGAPPDCHTAMY